MNGADNNIDDHGDDDYDEADDWTMTTMTVFDNEF